MALQPAISRLKLPRSHTYSILKYQHPPVFKKFVVHFVKFLSSDDRAAFRHWCIGIVPGSKLDATEASDGDIFKLIEFLCNANELSLTDMSLLKDFLLSVGRLDVLQALERVELLTSVGGILEDYVKGLRQGTSDVKFADSYANVVEFLLRIRDENQELISPLLEQFLQVNDDGKALAVLDSVILDSQLSWSTVISSLVITGELYSSFSPDDLAENGFFVCLFSETKASEFLTGWILENGGLKALDELVRKKQQVARSGSGLSSIEESLKENIKLLGNRVDVQ
ncbi:hypothetical protein ACROYT_G002228 [Oculina patagonica]